MAAAVKCDECGSFAAAHQVSPRFSSIHKGLPEGWVILNLWKGRPVGIVAPANEDSDVYGEFCGHTCAAAYLLKADA